METRIENMKNGEITSLFCSGVFIFAGMQPNLKFLNGEIARDRWGYVLTDDQMKTNLTNVFAVGDVRSITVKPITTAVADGIIAAKELSFPW